MGEAHLVNTYFIGVRACSFVNFTGCLFTSGLINLIIKNTFVIIYLTTVILTLIVYQFYFCTIDSFSFKLLDVRIRYEVHKYAII